MGQIAALKHHIGELQEAQARTKAENRRLNEHLAERSKELDAARAEITELRKQIKALEAESEAA